MAGKCDICGKGPAFGHNVSHSHHKTNRQFRPNIQRTTIYTNGQAKKLKVCTRCLRTLTKSSRMA